MAHEQTEQVLAFLADRVNVGTPEVVLAFSAVPGVPSAVGMNLTTYHRRCCDQCTIREVLRLLRAALNDPRQFHAPGEPH